MAQSAHMIKGTGHHDNERLSEESGGLEAQKRLPVCPHHEVEGSLEVSFRQGKQIFGNATK